MSGAVLSRRQKRRGGGDGLGNFRSRPARAPAPRPRGDARTAGGKTRRLAAKIAPKQNIDSSHHGERASVVVRKGRDRRQRGRGRRGKNYFNRGQDVFTFMARAVVLRNNDPAQYACDVLHHAEGAGKFSRCGRLPSQAAPPVFPQLHLGLSAGHACVCGSQQLRARGVGNQGPSNRPRQFSCHTLAGRSTREDRQPED